MVEFDVHEQYMNPVVHESFILLKFTTKSDLLIVSRFKKISKISNLIKLLQKTVLKTFADGRRRLFFRIQTFIRLNIYSMENNSKTLFMLLQYFY